MAKRILVNFNDCVGKIKPMHAINNAPLLGATSELFHYLGEAKIPYSRLHDTGGAYGNNRFVDIENIFRNFDADENSPQAYDFAFTDWLMEELDKQGVKPFFRLGATIENEQKIKAYRIFPPKDNFKWARICEHIIAHYNEGWANGYHMGIKYWEIWNEPDNYPDIADNNMWKGTFEEYIELYKTAAVHLKKRFGDSIKVGGYASCGFYALLDGYNPEAKSTNRTEYFIECFHKFMRVISDSSIPLDFFSWHSYSGVEANVIYASYAREQLDKYGYENTESILNEWNMGINQRGTLKDSVDISANILTLQNTSVDMLMYYDGQVHGSYQGLFNPIVYEPFKAYYIFKAFSYLYELGTQVRVDNSNDDIYCVAAKNGKNTAVMITNRGNDDEIFLKLLGIDSDKFEIYRLNQEENMENSETYKKADTVMLKQYETILILG